MVSVIEGAALYAHFQVRLNRSVDIAVIAAATIIIGFIFVLAVVDSRATRSHISRMRDFEETHCAPFPPTNLRPLFGFRTTRLAMMVVLVFNVGVMIGKALTGFGFLAP